MSGLDRAFIKAYSLDEPDNETPPVPRATPAVVSPLTSVVPAPHADFFSSAKAAPKEELSATTHEITDKKIPAAIVEHAGQWRDGGQEFSPYQEQLYSAPAENSESRAVFHVERFAWPDVCERLVDNASDEFDRLICELAPSGRPAGRSVAVTSCRRGEGSTSFTLCLAMAAVRAGVNAVIVDADLHGPELASRLGVLPQLGWEDVVAGRIRLSETLIESVADDVTLLPLTRNDDETSAKSERDSIIQEVPMADDLSSRPAPATSMSAVPKRDRPQTAETIAQLRPILDELRSRFELVLVDCGPLTSGGESTGSFSSDHQMSIDAAVLVEDVRLTSHDDIAAACRQLDLAGIPCAGLVENFAA